MEYAAFFVGYRYYVYLKKAYPDAISGPNRLSIILGAALGAFLGSRIMGFLEHPQWPDSAQMWLALLNAKTIMGGLFGGLLGVELLKKIIGEKHSSGDLFTLPLVLGIFVGRVGCAFAGLDEFTYGKPTDLPWGLDFGDGLFRHPIMVYELLFLILLFLLLYKQWRRKTWENGRLFQVFMLAYFGFRFGIEFLKPNSFFVFGLSSIQWLCVLCWGYYTKTITKGIRYAYQSLHLL
ncbi:diacylglyceryl transferase [Sediminicola luteus]|uniref:Diacylglyceryl transferase n=2 Tax=Sediminicola luteus TaxID=319238 RepID=A0A2A4G556_9FLAO|nr:diacylglyceryl transferase [Sediminicola luteus]